MSDDNTDDLAPGEAELVALARTLSVTDTHLDEPPAGLWAGIEALVAAGDPTLRAAEQASPAPVVHLRRRWPMVLAAAAASVAIVVGVVALTRSGDGPHRVEEVALSNVGLDAAGAASRGEATLVRLADGEYALDVEVSDLPDPAGGFLELWIIDTKVQGMYSLGPLHGSGRYVLPNHIDPAAFPVVDISIEPSDGVPAHSGTSILRGQLTL